MTILGGYLGAGKTTLVNQLLRHADGQRLAVLVNEFGALAIDADLIEAEEGDMISIAGGCICCSFGSDLAAALEDLSALKPAPDHVVIEASGVALPGAIATTVGLAKGVAVEGVVVLADAATLPAMLADEYIGDTLERQLSDAGLILLTKSDLAGSEALRALQADVEANHPDASVLTVAGGQVPNAVVLGPAAPHAISAGGHADADYTSLILLPGEVDPQALAAALTRPELGILRAKGYVATPEGPALVQVVGARAEFTAAPEAQPGGVVVIGLKARLDVETVRELERAAG